MTELRDLEQLRARLTPEQRARLDRIKRGDDPAPERAPRIQPRRDGGPAGLSYPQRRLWLLDRLMPNPAAYNQPMALRFRGELAPRRIERALGRVIERHEVLRTRFPARGDEPLQVVDPPGPVRLARIDLLGLPPARREEAGRAALDAETGRPFDLERGPVIRGLWIALATDEAIVVIDVHHIAFDTWSAGILLGELKTAYAAGADGAGTGPFPAPLPIQYADFAAWQNRAVDEGLWDAQLDYWRERLEGTPVLELPGDRPRPPVKSFRGATARYGLGTERTDDLERLARSHRATLYMVLGALLQAVLARWTGQDDISLGTPVAGRVVREVEPLIGFFSNTLVLRTDLSGDPTLSELIDRQRAEATAALARQELPFEKLVEHLRPARDLSQTALFQVMLVLQNAPRASFALPGVTVHPVDAHNGSSKFDLWLNLARMPKGLEGVLEYSTDLFDRTTALRLAERFRGLLASAGELLDRRLSELPLTTGRETHQVLREWNDSADPSTLAPASLHRLIARRVERSPDAVALAVDRESEEGRELTLSYRELHRRALRLASGLRDLGVGTGGGAGGGPLVGVAMERSAEMVLSLLGILAAGGAYVPLDPEYPRERLAQMVEDLAAASGGAPLVLVRSGPQPVPDLGSEACRFVAVDERGRLGSGPAPSDADGPTPTPLEAPAYVIFTSGSTGRPKGVAVPHAGIVNRILWMQAAYGLDGGDRVLQKTPFSFDVSVWEFFWPLVTGAALVMARPGGHKDPEYLAERIADQRVTTLHFVPPMLEAFLEGVSPRERCPSIRRVMSSGEALPRALVERFRAASDAELHNLYGPTEASVDVTAHPCADGGGDLPVPIGRPISNLRIHLVDRRQRLALPGAAGELLIGGVGLATGYVARPRLTAERFVPDPWSEVPGGRLYRTGDLARHRPDGSIEYRGRIDHQVKVRGFRIELGEIEHHLRSHPAVREALAMVYREPDGSRRTLTAYVVPEREAVAADDLAGDRVETWSEVFDRAYDEPGSDGGDPTFNIASWNSSYTDEPLPAREMREWVETTVARIDSLEPRRILEIGCGTGLLLFRLAPGRERYLGTDISARSLEHVRRHLEGFDLRGCRVDLRQAPADAPLAPAEERFDTVVLNSVVQYFPSLDYLLAVIGGALAALDDDGALFLGDVRNLELHEAFHASVERARAARAEPAEDLGRLRRRARRRVERDNELVVAPELFRSVVAALPGVGAVETHLRRGRCDTEMNRFRYDVVVRKGPAARFQPTGPAGSGPAEIDGSDGALREEELPALLARHREAGVVVRSVPNRRVVGDVLAARLLRELDGDATLDELDAALAAELDRRPGLDPERVHQAAEALGLEAATTWAASGEPAAFDLFVRPPGRGRRGAVGWPESPPSRRDDGRPLANDPMLQELGLALEPVLREHLQEHLPEFMVPRTTVFLHALPLAPNGKLDRRALPSPRAAATEAAEGEDRPETEAEATLAAIWSEVLAVPRIGTEQNFFALGGDSIHAIQVVARAKRQGLGLSPQDLFRHQTVRDLGRVVTSRRPRAPAEEPGGAFALSGLSGSALAALRADRPRAEDAYPPAPLQGHMLRIHQRLGTAPPGLYRAQWALKVPGRVEPEAYEAAWRHVVAGSSILRTSLAWRGLPEPLQVVERDVPIAVEWHDWRGLGTEEAEARTAAHFEAIRRRRLDFESAPPIQVMMARLGERAWQLNIDLNYAFLDGWTSILLLQRHGEAYRALVTGKEPPATAYPPYRVYMDWLVRQDEPASLAFWRRELDGVEGCPLDAGSADEDPRAFSRAFRLVDPELQAALGELARKRRLTLSTVFQGAWFLVLADAAGGDEVITGIASSGRPPEVDGIESMAGSTLNVLPARAVLDPGLALGDWLAGLQRGQVERSRHEHVPLDRIQEACGLAPDRGLFDSYLVFQNQLSSLVAARELSVGESDTPPQEASEAGPESGSPPYYYARMEFPLRVDAVPGRRFSISISDYQARRSDRELEAMAEEIERYLRLFVTDPAARLAGVRRAVRTVR